MSSKVASRTNGDSSSRTAARCAPYPTTTTANGRPIAGASYNSRRQPPAPAYRVETVQVNGKETEVLTIEDTPEPIAGPSNGARHDLEPTTHRGEPAGKRRKSDGAHISDQPYASSSSRANKHQANNDSTPRTSTNKRKHAADPYDGYQDRSVSSKRAPSCPTGLECHYVLLLSSLSFLAR